MLTQNPAHAAIAVHAQADNLTEPRRSPVGGASQLPSKPAQNGPAAV
ncbi:MAG: hypothetical protein AAGJ95_00675 [Cyanobacteria bacterium J06554_11]